MTVSNKIATPDNLYWPQCNSIVSAKIVDKAVILHWNDDQQSTLHPVWLEKIAVVSCALILLRVNIC